MRLRVLPPVGEPAALGPKSEPPTFLDFHPVWTQSGTAALALGIQLAMERRPDIKHPEVLLPAYGCPDLVAATVYAGARPVLVDIGEDDPGYDLGRLEQVWSGNTVAVVAVNFLGIRERVETLAGIARCHDAWLIEDSAQWYPEPAPGENSLSPAHAMVLSFGRGKPVSLLGGGALLLKEAAMAIGAAQRLPASSSKRGVLLSKLVIYNIVIRPFWYTWLTMVPGLGLGETRFGPLAGIQGMDECRRLLLRANMKRYLSKERWQERAISDVFASESANAVDLPRILAERSGRLLRYPVLFKNQAHRDRQLGRLNSRGLGVSAMYVRALPDVPGVRRHLDEDFETIQAGKFAARLLTLPVHSQVAKSDILTLRRELQAYLPGKDGVDADDLEKHCIHTGCDNHD
jgi:dTDP-4-amino-4,6-dideoxygalactose transaminase